jgi:hypothetical protein
MFNLLRRACGVVMPLHLLPSFAAAQAVATPETLPFHPRQWGAEFSLNRDFVGLGVLRFHSPRSAWLLNAHLGSDDAYLGAHRAAGTTRGRTLLLKRRCISSWRTPRTSRQLR